jgi:hypothetical protein
MRRHGPRANIRLLRQVNSNLNKFKFVTLKVNQMLI